MKRSIILGLIATIAMALGANFTATAQDYQLSSHILDINTGKPASGVTIKLYQMSNNQWTFIAQSITDANGRVRDFLPHDSQSGRGNPGVYKLCFEVEPYFAGQGVTSFYPFIDVVFEIKDSNHYHVPIVLSPFGYSTYRGN